MKAKVSKLKSRPKFKPEPLTVFELAKTGKRKEALRRLRNGRKSGPVMEAILSNPGMTIPETINFLKNNGNDTNAGSIYYVRSVLAELGLIGKIWADTSGSAVRLGSNQAKIRKALYSMQAKIRKALYSMGKEEKEIREVADETQTSYKQVANIANKMRKEAKLMKKQLNALIDRLKKTKNPKEKAVLIRAIKQLEGIEWFEVKFKRSERSLKPISTKLNSGQERIWQIMQSVISRVGLGKKGAYGLSSDDMDEVRNTCRRLSYAWTIAYDRLKEKKPLNNWVRNHISGVIADFNISQRKVNLQGLNTHDVKFLNSLLRQMRMQRELLQRKPLPGDEEEILLKAFKVVKAMKSYSRPSLTLERARRVLDEYSEHQRAMKSHEAFEHGVYKDK